MLEAFILALEPGEAVAAMIVAAVLSAVTAYRSYRNIHNARLIEDHPTSTARSAHQGYVELEGTGHFIDDTRLRAPYSGKECLWYRYVVEEAVQTRNGRRWKAVERGESSDTFLLVDSTGQVVIDPDGAEVVPVQHHRWTSSLGMKYAVGHQKTLAAVAGLLSLSSGRFRYTEEYLFPGMAVYAIGLLKNLQSHVGSISLRDRVAEVLRQWKLDQQQLVNRFDLDGDGKIDDKEWMLARQEARREAARIQQEEFKQYNDGLNIMIKPAETRRPYIISGIPPRKLVSRYRWRGAFALAAFFACGALAVYIFNLRVAVMIQ
ncbi:MAG: E3 ubiquitin ligase family protein [Gammaproteobacteria bacterium]|nr:E3 ubiquitin ligase family protein [Gammaproteobacteria bacterium]